MPVQGYASPFCFFSFGEGFAEELLQGKVAADRDGWIQSRGEESK